MRERDSGGGSNVWALLLLEINPPTNDIGNLMVAQRNMQYNSKRDHSLC